MNAAELKIIIRDGYMFDEFVPYAGAIATIDLPVELEVVDVSVDSDTDSYSSTGWAIIKIAGQYFKITGDNHTSDWSWGERFTATEIVEVEPQIETITTYKVKG